jgi:hypothetical protein
MIMRAQACFEAGSRSRRAIAAAPFSRLSNLCNHVIEYRVLVGVPGAFGVPCHSASWLDRQ